MTIPFPKRVSQIAKAQKSADYKSFYKIWIEKNPDYVYTLFTDDIALNFVLRKFSHREDIVHVYKSLHQRVIAADLLRYMLMYEYGGVYSDIDTECVRPVHEWNVSEGSNLVIGLEADELDESTFDDTQVKEFDLVYRLQITQWTLMSKPGHPVMARAIDRIVERVLTTAMARNMPVSALYFSQYEVLRLSGPGMYTDVVKDHLSHTLGRNVTDHEISSSAEHTLGDVMVLPVTAWAPGQRHSNSGSSDDSFVYHGFSGSWRSALPGWSRFLGIG